MGDFEEALANFNETLRYLRGNNNIDYEQLGLKFKLFSCEVLFNRGLCYIYLRQLDQGMQDLSYAAKEKVVPDHDVIDEAIREQAEGYTVFSIPVGIVYRPNEAKVKNLKAKDYLGKARLVAATDRNQTFTGFAGAEIKKMNEPAAAKDDRPQEKLSFAAANLVKTDIQSRYRQQSEPPLSRNVFPPTPPPESDKPSRSDSERPKIPSRAESVRAGPKPRPLDLTVAGFDRRSSDTSSASAPPPGRSRTQSERPDRGRPQRSATDAGSRARDSSYPEDVYELYGRTSLASAGRGRGPAPPRGMMIEEEDEDDDGFRGSYDEADFDMLNAPRSRGGSARSSAMRAPRAPPPEIRKVRVKVHAEDTRYVMIGTAVEFRDFVDQIRLKFGLRQAFKIMMKEDGDMITMADQDDLEMAIDIARDNARRRREETGKMEVRNIALACCL